MPLLTEPGEPITNANVNRYVKEAHSRGWPLAGVVSDDTSEQREYRSTLRKVVVWLLRDDKIHLLWKIAPVARDQSPGRALYILGWTEDPSLRSLAPSDQST